MQISVVIYKFTIIFSISYLFNIFLNLFTVFYNINDLHHFDGLAVVPTKKYKNTTLFGLIILNPLLRKLSFFYFLYYFVFINFF